MQRYQSQSHIRQDLMGILQPVFPFVLEPPPMAPLSSPLGGERPVVHRGKLQNRLGSHSGKGTGFVFHAVQEHPGKHGQSDRYQQRDDHGTSSWIVAQVAPRF